MEYYARVIEWMGGDDTGLSSKAIAMHMTGAKSNGSYPHDPADLGRCLRLLEKFPEWKPRIKEMAKYGGVWKRYSDRWEEMREAMESEVGIDWSKGNRAEYTYNLMREIAGNINNGKR